MTEMVGTAAVTVVFAQGPALPAGGWCIEIAVPGHAPEFFGPFKDKAAAIEATQELVAGLIFPTPARL